MDGANDIIADAFTRHGLDLLRVEAGQRRAVLELLTELEGDLVAQLARIDPAGAARETTQTARLETLLAQVRDTIRAAYRSSSQALLGELAELAEIEDEFAAKVLNDATGLNMATAVLTRAQAVALTDSVLVQGAPVAEWWSRQAGDTLQRFTDAMRLGIAQGDTTAQLIQRVRGGTRQGETVVGMMQISRRHAESLVRSATQAVAEAAKQATYDGNADIIKAIVWASTLDLRTTAQCAARDGKRYEPGTLEPIDHDLPWGAGPGNLHFGCRSASRPETKSWREMGLDIDDLPPATRASVNGNVAADLPFDEWLAKRPKAEQDEALGAGRAELWRSGKISFRDLLDANGRELSLAELRARL